MPPESRQDWGGVVGGKIRDVMSTKEKITRKIAPTVAI